MQAGIFPEGLCSPNMHAFCCRAFHQDTQCGPMSAYGEQFQEDAVTMAKRKKPFPRGPDPDHVIAERLLWDQQLQQLQATHNLPSPSQQQWARSSRKTLDLLAVCGQGA